MAKEPEEILGGDGNVLYLACGRGYVGVYICQKALNRHI